MIGTVQIHEHGGPEVLRFDKVEIGNPGPGEVRLRQTAIGVNYLDIYFRQGDLSPASFPFVNGFEGAGVIDAVGEGVSGLAVGQRVAYQLVMGAYTEERNISAERLVPLPDSIDDETAAAVMLKGMTAEYLVNRARPVSRGQTVLVHAAAGGVGLLLVQWAKHLGATVIGTVGTPEKAVLAGEHGCDHVIEYAHEDFVDRVMEITGKEGVDVAFDGVGRSTFHKNFECLATFGTNVLYGWSSGRVEPLDVHRLNGKSHVVLNPSLGHYTGTRERLLASAEALFKIVSSGDIRVSANHTYPLRQAARAHADLEARSTIGSVVLLP